MNSKFFMYSLTASFLWINLLPAQKLTDGFMILLSGDTITGYFRDGGGVKNPATIWFSESREDPEFQEFGASDILGFGVGQQIYQRALVQTEKSEYRTDQLLPFSDWILESNIVFLKRVISGKKELWLYVDSEGKRHYYIPSFNRFELLQHKRYIGPHKRVISREMYKQQLAQYLSDCPALIDEYNDLEYTDVSLRSLYKAYYNCNGGTYSELQKADPFKVEVGLLGGVTQSDLDFGGLYIDYLTIPRFPTSYDITGGMFLDVFIPGANYLFSFHNSVNYVHMDTDASYTEVHNTDWRVTTDSKFTYGYLKFINALQIKPSIGRSRFQLGIGLTNGFAVIETQRRKETTIFYLDTRVLEEPALARTNRHELGFAVTAGYEHSPICVRFVVEKTKGMSNIATLSSKINRKYLMLGYSF